MPQISCPHCNQVYDLTPEQVPQYAGQTITCAKCQRPFTVPAQNAQVPPPLPVQPYPYQGGQTVNYAQPNYVPQQTNGMAIASLVSGCVGFIIPLVPSVLAIIFGIIGIRKTRDPRVGGKGLAIAGLCVGAASIFLSGCMISILLPSLNRARETANRVKCASNMRQIGQAILLYSNENQGAMPTSIDLLITTQDIEPMAFICPSGSDTPASGATPQAQAQDLMKTGHLSYVYLGKGMNADVSPETIVLHEPLTNHNDGINVLFGDGHVEFFTKGSAQYMISEVQSGHNPPRAR